MKMANMDAVTGFMFTDPKKSTGVRRMAAILGPTLSLSLSLCLNISTSLLPRQASLGPLEILYFADLCAGPGGFSEYVLWRKKWHAKGFGFTLKGPPFSPTLSPL